MAIPSWLKVTPKSGTGGQTVQVTAESNESATVARQYNIVLKTNSGLQKTIRVNQREPYTTVNIHFHGENTSSKEVYENFPLSFYSGQSVLLATAVGSGAPVSSGSPFTAADKQVSIVSNRNVDGVMLSISGTSGVGFSGRTKVSIGDAETYVTVVGQRVSLSPAQRLEPGGEINMDVEVIVTNP